MFLDKAWAVWQMSLTNQGSSTVLLDEIRQVLLARYRDLAEPWYGWVLPAHEAKPHGAVLDGLTALGAMVEDGTDLNVDVSCRWIVRWADALVIAELSLVGPYAVVLDGNAVGSLPAPGLVQEASHVLQECGLRVLDAEVLRMPVEMPFENIGQGQGTLYQALFADTPGPFGPPRP